MTSSRRRTNLVLGDNDATAIKLRVADGNRCGEIARRAVPNELDGVCEE